MAKNPFAAALQGPTATCRTGPSGVRDHDVATPTWRTLFFAVVAILPLLAIGLVPVRATSARKYRQNP